MQRCLELARHGAGYVAPNPMVGAVLVYDDKIIGEGWHEQYGGAHAEVNCISSVKKEDKALISRSTLYVSLEPCAHYGKTPPCADLIIRHKIPKVVIGCRDPFKEVDGKGIEKLEAAGVEVEEAERLLRYACKQINKRFFTFHKEQRPFIVLKWAQTGDGKIASLNPSKGGTSDPVMSRLMISNEYSNRLVHQWRSEEAAILVGTNTALLDDPELTTRLWPGPSPIRLVIDMDLRLPKTLRIYNREHPTIVFNSKVHDLDENMTAQMLKKNPGPCYYKVKQSIYPLREITNALYRLDIQSVLVEGGAKLLQSFIDEGLWDEMRIINNYGLLAGGGLPAPKPENAILVESMELFSDTIETYMPASPDH
ncbi:MAG: bifunctional diaminohydroxyphosphoribosylaminopyrimidine deaminase/5-amino-6-(5-phosphoribosylamino)uracil reductase RibD [Ferruginibacter sp.]|nr:bifunctional diaminohydroxyphosphoribosylaminopyrimidine deaminase/5-amino-6-(5-phosphoribosylamino)uracil reductase RibD [Chitinophagaceae bacterium]